MTTYADLAAALDGLGLAVQLPGEPDKALPCISLEPVDISLVQGARVGFETCNVMIRYPLAQGNDARFDALNASAYEALRALLGSQFAVDLSIPLFGNADTSPPSFAYQLTVVFPGRDICDPPT